VYVTQFNVTDRRELFFRKYDRTAGISFMRVQFQRHSYMARVYLRSEAAPFGPVPGELPYSVLPAHALHVPVGLAQIPLPLCLINRAFTVTRV